MQTSLHEYIKAGIASPQDSTILCFLRSQEKKEELHINKACQNIMTCLLFCLNTAIINSDKNVKGSFWYNVHVFLASDKFTQIIKSFPKGMTNRRFVATIVFSLVNILVAWMHPTQIPSTNPISTPSLFPTLAYQQLHSHLGYRTK